MFAAVALVAQDGETSELEAVLPAGLTATDWITAGVVFAASVVVGRVIQSLIRRLLRRTEASGAVADFVPKLARNLVILAGVVYALQVLDVAIGPLLGVIGIGGLAVAFAAQAILENVFSSILLQTRRPFRAGDQIFTNDHEGTVEEVTLRTVVLRTYEGERVILPCSAVLNNPMVNHTVNGVRRTSLTVGVHYRTDLVRAQQVMLAAVGSVRGVRSAPAPEVWVHGFGDSSIDFEVRFWHEPDNATLWRVRSGVGQAVKAAFDDAEIEIPFPQRVLTFAAGTAGDIGMRPEH